MKSKISSLLIFIALFLPCLSQSQTLDTLVDIGSHKMHFTIWEGEGIPILFESGGGNDGTIWADLLKPLYVITGTTLIAYDRSGYGKSEINTKLPDDKKGLISSTVDDLEMALGKLGFGEEFIFVAHSYGGFTAALYSSKYPDRVKGIVLFDTNLKSFFTDSYLVKMNAVKTPEFLDNLKKNYGLGLYYESLAFPESVEQIKKVDFPDAIPIIDIVAEDPPFNIKDKAEDERWKLCHAQFAEAHPNCEGIVAYSCHHYLFRENPTLAINAIVKMLYQTSDAGDQKGLLERSLNYGIESSNNDRKRASENKYSEYEINSWGYALLSADKPETALKVLKFNMLLYPESANVYDSYGEALRTASKRQEAIKMYRKAIELDPTNEAGKIALKELLEGED